MRLIEKGTLIVYSIQEDEICIATDSRLYSPGKIGNEIKDEVEKVIKLKDDLIFALAGVANINQRNGYPRIQLDKVAKEASTANNLNEIANNFASIFESELQKVPQEDLNEIIRMSRQLGQENLFESIFAGKDLDGKLKVATVSYRFTPNGIQRVIEIEESKPERDLSFIGTHDALRAGFTDKNSPIGSLDNYRNWHNSTFSERKIFDASLVVEALVHLGIKHVPENKKFGLGYPIYTYRLDKNEGLQKLRTTYSEDAPELPNTE